MSSVSVARYVVFNNALIAVRTSTNGNDINNYYNYMIKPSVRRTSYLWGVVV